MKAAVWLGGSYVCEGGGELWFGGMASTAA